MAEDERNAGRRRSAGERSKGHQFLLQLESARARIRSNEPDKLETALRAVPVEEMFEQIETAETKPTILHQIVHSAPSEADFDALIDAVVRVVCDRSPELRHQAQPLAGWVNAFDGQGLTPLHRAVSLLGLKPRRANRAPAHALHVVRRLVSLGAVLWLQSLEARTALEYLLDSEERYQEEDEASRRLVEYFLGELGEGAPVLTEAEVVRMLKSCARYGYHTPLSALLPHCPSAADECFLIGCQEGRLACVDALLPRLQRAVLTAGMQEACKHSRVEIVRRLLPLADLNAPSAQGWGCLQLASASGHADVVELLLQRGAKPVASPASPHALHLAARNGHVPVLTLLARSLLADEPDVDGRTALHYAAAALAVPPDPPHEWRAAEALLLKSLNSFDDEGLTPLAYSLRRWAEQEGGKPDPDKVLRTVEFLIKRGANVDVKGEPRRAGLSVSGAMSAAEIAQERCASLRPEVIVAIWKASRPAAVVAATPAPAAARDRPAKRPAPAADELTEPHAASPFPPDLKRFAPAAASASAAPAPAGAGGARALRFVEVVRDEAGAMVWPPEFLVQGAPDAVPHMPLGAVPVTHRHAAIALAVREGRLTDAQRKELYDVWRAANPL